jgi:LmbE family N-acetylglucosaminyl deacetylase
LQSFWLGRGAPRSVLCLGAHSDDIEIGCGGTLLLLRERFPETEIRWVVFSAIGPRRAEALASASLLLGDPAEQRLRLETFRDGFLPFAGEQVKRVFEELKREHQPDLIFTHYRRDLHQDHRLVCELTWNTFRDHPILEYEIPKWDGDLGAPNVFVPLEATHAERKIEILLEVFGSQRSHDWFDADTFRALMRLRGVESRAPSHYAEAFYAPKLVLAPG